jgi:hypothetical protein
VEVEALMTVEEVEAEEVEEEQEANLMEWELDLSLKERMTTLLVQSQRILNLRRNPRTTIELHLMIKRKKSICFCKEKDRLLKKLRLKETLKEITVD